MVRKSLTLSLSLVAVAALVAAQTAPTTENPSPSTSAFELNSGIVVDTIRPALYLMNVSGGIDALNPSTGEVFWSSQAAAKPLGLHDGLLACQVDGRPGDDLLILLADAESGATQMSLKTPLPAGVVSSVDDGLNGSFSARSISADNLYVAWQATRQPLSPVQRAGGATAAQEFAGAIVIDQASKSARAIDLASIQHLEPSHVELVSRNVSRGGPWLAGNVVAGTERTSYLGTEILVLKRQGEDDEKLADVELARGPTILHMPSVDQSHLLVSQRVDPGAWNEYRWTIFELESGLKLGEVRRHHSNGWFMVHQGTLLCEGRPHGRLEGSSWVEKERTLQAIDLETGNLLWEHPLRDTRYTGSFPP